LAALALVCAAVPLARQPWWLGALSIVPFGLAAADAVAGPAPGGALLVRVVASVVATVVAFGATRAPLLSQASVALAAAAVVCAGVAR
jgi:hypothetical protein